MLLTWTFCRHIESLQIKFFFCESKKKCFLSSPEIELIDIQGDFYYLPTRPRPIIFTHGVRPSVRPENKNTRNTKIKQATTLNVAWCFLMAELVFNNNIKNHPVQRKVEKVFLWNQRNGPPALPSIFHHRFK